MSPLTIRAADYTADHVPIRAIRFAVFVDEQHVPPDLELDERDALCMHLLAFANGTPVGTGRLDVAAAGKVGRVAVLPEWRGRGVGTALMRRFHELAAERGLRGVWCNAQLSAAPFYERLGYRAVGGRFMEAGIEHVRMERAL